MLCFPAGDKIATFSGSIVDCHIFHELLSQKEHSFNPSFAPHPQLHRWNWHIDPWLKDQMGKKPMDGFRLLKKPFDSNNILNPGGTLGLYINPAQREKCLGEDLEV